MDNKLPGFLCIDKFRLEQAEKTSAISIDPSSPAPDWQLTSKGPLYSSIIATSFPKHTLGPQPNAKLYFSISFVLSSFSIHLSGLN
jgi:hypothetical protein